MDKREISRIQQEWIMSQCLGRTLHVGCGEKPIFGAINIDPNPSRAAWRDFDYDVHDLPLEDGEFDSVVSNHVLPSLQRIDVAMREMARVLKTGGNWSHVIPDWSHAPKRCDPRHQWQYQHQGWHSPDEFRKWMERYKDLFQIEVCEHFPGFDGFSFRVVAFRL